MYIICSINKVYDIKFISAERWKRAYIGVLLIAPYALF